VKKLIQLDKVCRSPGPDREEQIAFRFIRACILGGWRWAEVAGLSFDLVEDDAEFPEIEGVEVDDDYVIIGRAWKRKSKKWGPTKPGVAWTAVITPGLRAVISECHRENGGVGLLFPNPSRANEPFPYESFRKYLLAALDQARLKQKPGYLQKSLRHSFVHAAKRAGVPERWVSQHYGHSDEKMIRKVYGKRELRRTIPSKAEIREAENFFGFVEFVQKSMTA
jgi:integrase